VGWESIVAIIDAAGPVVPPEIPRDEKSDKKSAARKRRSNPSSTSFGEGESGQTLAPQLPEPAAAPDHPDSFAVLSSLPPPAPPVGNESAATLAEQQEAERKNAREEAIEDCARLDHSDTDNGKRLIAYFGQDLLVRMESGVAAGAWLHWRGTHWDIDSGAAGIAIMAQQVGEIIMDEARFIRATDAETEVIADGQSAGLELKELKAAGPGDGAGAETAYKARLAELLIRVKEGQAARAAVQARRRARRKHGLATKMRARMAAMQDCAGPHLRVSPDDFNPDPLKVATRTHTLRFLEAPDPECPDPDAARLAWTIEAVAAHRREDMITAMVPLAYDPQALCPKWCANLARFQPDPAQRRTVQQFSGLGLLGKPIQRVMFHYGTGGNFKSVFLETLTRVLGDSFAVGLPTESLIGGAEGNAGGPRPDLERVFGKRMLRILELPSGATLKADLIKKLTGGERWPIRTLYKSFYEFTPCAKTHMSGNDYPRFDGSDGGMQRRLLVVEWPVKIPESEERDFDIVLGELLAEAPGILNWLIEGALDYLRNGLFVSDATRATTRDYFDEMDPVARFVRDCIAPAPGESVGAREMYLAYKAHCEANSRNAIYETRFGLIMKKRFAKNDESRKRAYLDVRLHDVPQVAADNEPPPRGNFAAESLGPRQGGDDDVVHF
jgi:putative DNA primase/helicase